MCNISILYASLLYLPSKCAVLAPSVLYLPQKCAVFATSMLSLPQKCTVFALWCLTMQTVKTQNIIITNPWLLKFNFSMGLRSVELRLAALLCCWTWTEKLVVASSWTNERLRAQAVESDQREINIYHLLSCTVLSGWLAVAFFKKSAAGVSFARHRQHWKPLILGDR